MNRFELVIKDYQDVIFDTETQKNFLFLATSGFGTRSSTIDLAKKVVDFLNTLPEETIS